MEKFIVFGRGRSGTTVLADELGRHPDLHCVMHEVTCDGIDATVIEPFARRDRPAEPDASVQLRQMADLPPYDWWTLRECLPVDAAEYPRYLDELEAWSASQGTFAAVGFKIIDNQMHERPGLLEELVRRDYRIVHIRRRNVVRHALSGLIARQRGIYNARNFAVPRENYVIEPIELLRQIKSILLSGRYWERRLRECGAPVIHTVYEEFLADREAFYAPIFDFLEVEPAIPPSSDFTKMTPSDLSAVIANYEEIRVATEHIGMQELLVEV